MSSLMDAVKLLAESGISESIIINAIAKARTDVRDDFGENTRDRNLPPRRELLRVGPELSASGSGAARATGLYSDPATQLLHVEAFERLSQVLESHGDQIGRLEANQKAQLALIGKIAAGINPTLSKAIAQLLSKADDREDDDDDEHRPEDDDDNPKAEKSLADIVAAMGSTDVRGLMTAVAGRPISKAAAVDAAVNAIAADSGLTEIDRLAGFSAATCVKACLEGSAAPLVAKARLDALPDRVREHFHGVI